MKFEFKSLFDLQSAFPDEQSCIDHLENMIWGDMIISPFDATSKVYKCKGNKYRCKNTGKYFNVKTGTLFDNSKIELRKWFMAIWLVTSHKKGISSVQLSKDIGVTQKTAWFMLERIRKCFGTENNNRLDDVVEFLSTDNPVLSNDLTKSTHELITNVHIPEMNIVSDDASTVTGR